ncbi:hypothetical protein F8M41_004832 [Gigaspora margarita]|uniref:Uncharacterized protein n=1 Tax=Gigaspora margarita TaxID=4874 RepID=A0A8H3XAM2_GIGMA|nr:hypothetical protein F8M41_004832 [Gigaspora margarita]
MTNFEYTYLEEYDDLDKNYEETFTINSIILENAQALLPDDENESIDFYEIESKDADFQEELFPTIGDETDIEIEEIFMQLNLTLFVIIDIIEGKIKYCNSTNKLRQL